MIQATELRIGNIVIDNVTNTIGMVTQIDHRDNDIYSSIPLTEDWLIRMGFEKGDYPNFTIMIGSVRIRCRIQIGINYTELSDIYLGDKCRYVHQLQNLIFALSGRELEIKL